MCIRRQVVRSRRCTGALPAPERPRNRSCRYARSLRTSASLLSPFPPLAGVAAKTSRSIKPRERDLRDLRLFVLVRFFTRPTNHPRHAACASNDESKPVRPRDRKHTSNDDLVNACRVKSDTKISERFRGSGFNGVMQMLAYVASNPPFASHSNMAGLRWQRLTKSPFALFFVCIV